ncbi:MAG: GDP-mannose 4,6-dehydratase [Parvibaculum sp.]
MPRVENFRHSVKGPTALISGITGQDGGYLAGLLLGKGYVVHGFSRNIARFDPSRLNGVPNAEERLHLHTCDLQDEKGLVQLLEVTQPDEIYNLAGQSHIQTSFENQAYTSDVNAASVVRFLNALVKLDPERRIRFCQASSSEIFGDTKGRPQNEATQFRPLSPYAVSKHAAFEAIVEFREAFGTFATNAILFNHESPFRGMSFVTRKISLAVAAYHHGTGVPLRLGNLDARRDWGHARDYVEGMWLMLQQDRPSDYVLASGENHSVREFVEYAFAESGRRIAWAGTGVDEVGCDASSGERLVEIDPAFFRMIDVDATLGDPTRAHTELGWRRHTNFPQLVREMVTADIASLSQAAAPN